MTFLEDFNYIEYYECLTEDVNGQRKYILRGVLGRAGIPNQNKRIYTPDIMAESLREIMPLIKQRGFVGELDHPPTPKINVAGISHIITKLSLAPDGALIGEMEALDTDAGRQLKKLMEAKVRLGASTRGLGQVKPYTGPLGEGLVEVVKGYKMKAIDIVFDPSAGAFPNQVVESTEIILGSTASFRRVWEDCFGLGGK
jgi:hypothetical protein